MKQTLESLRQMVESYAKIIDAPPGYLPIYGNWQEGHNIEIDENGQLYYQSYERGRQEENYFALDEDDLCYKIFASVTFGMSVDYEVNNRVVGQDFRRIMFAKQEELLGKLHKNWEERRRKAHQSILQRYPFDDKL